MPKLTGLQAPSAVQLASNGATSSDRTPPMLMLGAKATAVDEHQVKVRATMGHEVSLQGRQDPRLTPL